MDAANADSTPTVTLADCVPMNGDQQSVTITPNAICGTTSHGMMTDVPTVVSAATSSISTGSSAIQAIASVEMADVANAATAATVAPRQGRCLARCSPSAASSWTMAPLTRAVASCGHTAR